MSHACCGAPTLPSYNIVKIKVDDITSSHCTIIHVPQFPLLDGNVDSAICMTDVTIETVVEVDLAKVRNENYEDVGILGEIWDDTVDPECNPFIPKEYQITPVTLLNNGENWYTPYWQFCLKDYLDQTPVVVRTGTNGGVARTGEQKVPCIRAAMITDSGKFGNQDLTLGEPKNNNFFTIIDVRKFADNA